MSTRCVITVKDEDGEFALYRHSDGYPDGEHGVLAGLTSALPYAWSLPRFEADDFAAAIVRAWKQNGGNIRLTSGKDAHGDIEYHYLVTCEKGVVRVRVQVPQYDTAYNVIGWKPKGKAHLIRAIDDPLLMASLRAASSQLAA